MGSGVVVPVEEGTLLILTLLKQPIQQRINTWFTLEGIEKWVYPMLTEK